MPSDDIYNQAETTPSPAPEKVTPATSMVTRLKKGSIAGRLGGAAVRERYGSDYFARIGRKGGEKVRNTLGLRFYEGIGQKGGKKVAAQRGIEFYREIGRRGGQAQRRKKPDKGTDPV